MGVASSKVIDNLLEDTNCMFLVLFRSYCESKL